MPRYYLTSIILRDPNNSTNDLSKGPTSGIIVVTSLPGLINAIKDYLNQQRFGFPKLGMTVIRTFNNSSEPQKAYFHRLSDNDAQAYWEIIRFLGVSGWEPISHNDFRLQID